MLLKVFILVGALSAAVAGGLIRDGKIINI
jgi:hypothetical protein